MGVDRGIGVRPQAKRKSRSVWPTARAVTDEQAKPSFEDLVRELKAAKEAEARSVWQASGLEKVTRQSAQAAPSSEVTGWGLLGPNLYRKLGGDSLNPSLPEKGSEGWAALEAAGLLPFGRPLRAGVSGVKRLTSLGRGGKATEEVVEKALPAGAEKIIESLPKAKKLRTQQEALRSVERGKRVAKAAEAMKVGGQEGYHAALRELKGELPKVQFGALKEMDQATVEELFSYVGKHPDLQFFEQIRTQAAMTKMIDKGQLPTRSEQLLLERAFGPEVAAQLMDSRGFWNQAKELGLSLINVPRALRSSFDLSAPFRQGLVLGARHPRMFSKELAPMVKSAGSESYYQELMDGLVARPWYEKMEKAGLQLTDLEASVYGREEQFMSNLAEKIPVIGRVVRASGRGYVGFLNKFRADAVDNYLRMAEKQGLDVEDPALLKGIASWVNHATGRGSIKHFEDSMVVLNALLFSPRLIASRVQLLNPAYYAKLDPFARKQAIRGMTQLLGGISLTLWMAKLNGAEVGLDPRSSDFGKIKVGDTRVDIAGGFQQYLVYAARFIKGETVSSTTGDVKQLEGGFGKKSRASITWDFIENKAAPVPGLALDAMKGKNFVGDDFDPLKETGRILLPLGVENAYEGYTVGGPKAGAASLLLGGIGFGTQTYGANTTKKKKRRSNSLWVP